MSFESCATYIKASLPCTLLESRQPHDNSSATARHKMPAHDHRRSNEPFDHCPEPGCALSGKSSHGEWAVWAIPDCTDIQIASRYAIVRPGYFRGSSIKAILSLAAYCPVKALQNRSLHGSRTNGSVFGKSRNRQTVGGNGPGTGILKPC